MPIAYQRRIELRDFKPAMGWDDVHLYLERMFVRAEVVATF